MVGALLSGRGGWDRSHHFFDEDGKVYYIGTHPIIENRQYDGECHIWIQELDIGSMKLVGERKDIARKLKALGYGYVTLDLEGFRSGSMDEGLPCRVKEETKRGTGQKL